MRKYINKDDLKIIKELDLLTYLMNYEPDELVKISRNVYSIKSHGSLKISNGLWTWWAKNIGGKSALDYLIKVNNYDFLDAALYLKECITKNKPVTPNVKSTNIINKQSFKLPIPNGNNDKIIHYLCDKRCIDKDIVEFCIKHYDIYESRKDHSVVFVGYDKESKPRYAFKRSIVNDDKRDVIGSNKRYGFSLSFQKNAESLYVFEGAIDLLSYITILKQQNIDWKCNDYISLGNASLLGKNKSNVSLPIALEEYLSHNKNVKNLYLHLDNDKAGLETTKRIKIVLKDQYTVFDKTPKGVKDINQLLKNKTLKSKTNVENRKVR